MENNATIPGITGDTDMLLCGGGAGGGRLQPSQSCWPHPATARVLIVRRSYPMLEAVRPCGRIQEIQPLRRRLASGTDLEVSSGATIQFAALPDKLGDWQGLQASRTGRRAAEFTMEEILPDV
jgi:hypothetical protein